MKQQRMFPVKETHLCMVTESAKDKFQRTYKRWCYSLRLP